MTEVFLHVYDVANGDSIKTNNAIIQLNKCFKDGFRFGGIFHSAVEVYGQREWSFGYCETGTGVFSCSPKKNTMYLYRESLSLGHTALSSSKVKGILFEMRKEWPGNSYDVLSRNCNHFCNDLCMRLGVQKPPAWVNRLANAGETAVGVAETTSKWVKQAKAEMVSASKVAYHALFSAASKSAVSPEPGLLAMENSTSSDPNTKDPLSRRTHLLKAPAGNLFSKLSVVSHTQLLN